MESGLFSCLEPLKLVSLLPFAHPAPTESPDSLSRIEQSHRIAGDNGPIPLHGKANAANPKTVALFSRPIMATHIRSRWTVSETDFPHQGTPREKLTFALTYALLAPAKSNSQPWRFRVGDTYVDLQMEPDQSTGDSDAREATLACGASLLHLRLALAHFGCYGKVDYERNLDEPERLARVHLGTRKAKESWE